MYSRDLDPFEEDGFITDLALNLQSVSYPPLEAVILADEPATRMYIVQKGLCARPGQLLGKDMIFGDDMIMTQTRYVESVTTYV